MGTVTLEDVVHLAEQLTPDEQAALVKHLQARLQSAAPPYRLTREQVLAEFDRRKARGVFETAEILRNKYANPAIDLTEEELLGVIHEAATEWEKELDEFFGDD